VTASTAAKRVALDARPKSKYKKDKRPALKLISDKTVFAWNKVKTTKGPGRSRDRGLE